MPAGPVGRPSEFRQRPDSAKQQEREGQERFWSVGVAFDRNVAPKRQSGIRPCQRFVGQDMAAFQRLVRP
eukprot:10748153-Lingulodinium_polyedra.AAC.1